MLEGECLKLISTVNESNPTVDELHSIIFDIRKLLQHSLQSKLSFCCKETNGVGDAVVKFACK